MDKKNKDKSIALAYHEATKHSYLNIKRGQYLLDWEVKPSPYKIYKGFPKIDLSKRLDYPTLPALEAIKMGGYGGTGRIKSIGMLAEILHLSYGHTAKKVYPGITYYLRSAPSAGALYPIEVYLTVNDIGGLEDGLYHYTPFDSSIYLLRRGDFRKIISEATGENRIALNSQLTMILTAIFWRSSWKYQDRAYRYCLLDTGHLIGNILAVGSSLGLGPLLIENFIDSDINQLLGIDVKKEVAMAVIPFERGTSAVPAKDQIDLSGLQIITDPLKYPGEMKSYLINQAHTASSYKDKREFIKIVPSIYDEEKYTGEISYLSFFGSAHIKEMVLSNTITRRRSSRDFQRENIPFEILSMILHYSFQGYRSDITDNGLCLLDTYLIINGVYGITPGLYYFSREEGALGKIRISGSKERNIRDEVAYLCLEQELCGNASAVFFFVADLNEKIDRYGERIYRYLHLEAGILGENIYLAATALGLGATGIGAFFDDDLADFLGIAKDGKNAIYVMAIGVEKKD